MEDTAEKVWKRCLKGLGFSLKGEAFFPKAERFSLKGERFYLGAVRHSFEGQWF